MPEPSATTSDLLVATSVSKSFPGTEEPLEILKDVSLTVASAEAIAITGPSGCGKSTFLSLVGALDEPSSGSICVDGIELTSLSESEKSRYRNETVGFVFQDHHLLPQCTVMENVLIPTIAGGRSSNEDMQYAEELLQRVGLGERVSHFPGQISGGERQRVALCRALINRPKLLLADEPTGNLDPATADSVGELLLSLGPDYQASLICVTHSHELASRFPRHLKLDRGSFVEAQS